MQTVEQAEEQSAKVEISDYEKERGKPMPNYTHGAVQANMIGRLYSQLGVDYRIVSELTLEFADGLILTPDISVLAKRSVNWGREPVRSRDLPLVVEILSPSQGYLPVVEKIDAYFLHGVRSVWEVNPALRAVIIHRPGNDEPLIVQQGEAKDPVTGLSVRLEEVFA